MELALLFGNLLVSAILLALVIRLLLPLAQPQVDLLTTIEVMPGLVQEAIREEMKLLEDRERKRRDRTPPEEIGQIPTKVIAGQPYRPGG